MSVKLPYPGVQDALQKYYQLRKRLHNYFFHGVQLKISNTQTILAYSDVYNLIDKNPQVKLNNQKKYELYEQTLFNIFKKDLTTFSQEVRQNLIQKKGISSPVDELQYYYEWIVHYTWFLRWTHKIMSSIQKNIAVFSRNSLYFTGLTIMRQQIINPLYSQIFRLIIANLQLFKQGSLHEYTNLQFMIQVIGMCGFVKYFSVKLEKNDLGFFQFVSINKQTNAIAQVQYETDYFLRKFTNQYVKYLKKKYTIIIQDMIQLSTPQYVNKTTQYLQKQQKAADFFYPNQSQKNIIIRSIQQTLIASRCKQLIQNTKTGLTSMIQQDNIQGLKNLYKLTKRTSQQKLFGQYYQNCIQRYINEQILLKLTPQEQKAAKKQTVSQVIDSLYEYYIKIQKITIQVQQFHKDPTDLVLISSQSNGFQMACNKNNIICNFLAYYCDNILKKQTSAVDNNCKELLIKLGKLLKFLYSLDQFLKVYQRMLGVRILYDTYKNKQVQSDIINLLKKQVGIGSINKITTMIQDYKFSQNFNSERSTLFRNKIPFHFNVNLITSGAWQIQDLKSGKKLVPMELMKAVQIFQEEYKNVYPGRQITWVFNYGRAIVQVKFNDQTKALLMLNNYQLLIVLCLQRKNFTNTKISDVISEIKPEEEHGLMAAIMMLVKKGVLKKQGNPTKIQSKSQTISFNFDLKLKAPKLGCFQVPRFAQRLPAINKQLDAQRSFIIQANIVKLMKMKRVLRYQQIITQVMGMCKTFKADIGMIKNQIQNCIHREFLERDSKQFNTLIYKP